MVGNFVAQVDVDCLLLYSQQLIYTWNREGLAVMASLSVYIRETRPQFLLLTPACFLVGVSTAVLSGGGPGINIGQLLIVLVGAVAAHAAVNVLNDYFDYKSGLDLNTQRTPFSGGSGILPAGAMSPASALMLGLGALAATVAVGIYVMITKGPGILWAGLPGLILVAFYTQIITKRPWLCLLAPGLGFGPCMVLGTHFALVGSYSWTAIVASLVPGLLVSNLLLLNQFPDVEADRLVCRHHVPILFGRKKSAVIYAGIALGTYAWLVLAVLLHLLPWPALIALLPLPLVLSTSRGVRKHADNLPQLIPLLGQNVMFTLATPVLLALGLLASRMWL